MYVCVCMYYMRGAYSLCFSLAYISYVLASLLPQPAIVGPKPDAKGMVRVVIKNSVNITVGLYGSCDSTLSAKECW